MKYIVSILSEAEGDIDKAYIWYELRQINLGNKFYKKVEESVQFISNNPYCCGDIFKGIRRYIIKKIPMEFITKSILNPKRFRSLE
jgi:hypothetical protein